MEVDVMEPEAKVCGAFRAIDVLMAKLQRTKQKCRSIYWQVL